MSELVWLGVAGIDPSIDSDRLVFRAGPETDWFCDPRTDGVVAGAPVLVRYHGPGPAVLSALVEAEHDATFDAGGLFVHFADDQWVKFAIERSPEGRSTVVTVRTSGRSDDCNHWVLDGTVAHLRAAVDEQSVAFHVEEPDGTWRLARYCARPSAGPFSIGLIVQSPTGTGVRGTFSRIETEERIVTDLRDGS